ncbi:hypothetical protein AOLI_G00214060 [Acnodon oligacanthus]
MGFLTAAHPFRLIAPELSSHSGWTEKPPSLASCSCTHQIKILMLAYKAKNGPAPTFLMPMVKSQTVPRNFRASSTARLDPPSFKVHGRRVSRMFSVLAPKWWNELPLAVRTAESLGVFKCRLKMHLFTQHLNEH